MALNTGFTTSRVNPNPTRGTRMQQPHIAPTLMPGYLFDGEGLGPMSPIGVVVREAPILFWIEAIPENLQVSFRLVIQNGDFVNRAGNCCFPQVIVPRDLGESTLPMTFGGKPWIMHGENKMAMVALQGAYAFVVEIKGTDEVAPDSAGVIKGTDEVAPDSAGVIMRYMEQPIPKLPLPREYILGLGV